jgi:hypothetical protein
VKGARLLWDRWAGETLIRETYECGSPSAPRKASNLEWKSTTLKSNNEYENSLVKKDFYHFIVSFFIIKGRGDRMEYLREDVREYLELYTAFLLEVMPAERVHGIYLYGSLALGAFDPDQSDIDFITVLNGEISNDDEEQLKVVHLRSNSNRYGAKMDGCYLTVDQVGKLNHELERYPFYAEGKMHHGHYDLNNITWWLLQTKGIVVYGEPLSTLKLNIQWSDVQTTLNDNLNTYWNEKLERDMCFFYDDWIEFGVITVSRIFLSLKYESIFSKTEAVAKTLPLLPSLYHPILLEGSRLRTNPESESYYHSTAVRREDMKRFLSYIISYCSETFELEKA